MSSFENTADYCPTCGHPRERPVKELERLGLTLALGSLSFEGRSVHLSPAQYAFIQALMERGRASREFLVLRICPETESNQTYVYACQVRRVLQRLTGGKVLMSTVWSWGYELTAVDGEADARG